MSKSRRSNEVHAHCKDHNDLILISILDKSLRAYKEETFSKQDKTHKKLTTGDRLEDTTKTIILDDPSAHKLIK